MQLFHFTLLMMFHQTVCLRMIREDCEQEELSRCAKPLQVLQTTTNITFEREELDKLCPDLNSGLRCIQSYTRRCMTQIQRNQFNKIYQGTTELIKDLCQPGDFQKEFLKHSACLQTVRPQHDNCAVRYREEMSSIFKVSANRTAHNQHQQQNSNNDDESDEEFVKIVCCSFRKYLDCSEFVTRRTCGMETGLFIRDFIHRMSDTLMRNYCEEYYKGSNHCSNEFSSASLKNSSSAILFTFVGISIAIQRNS
ncbi:uncharacterized protein [Chironomus tepperi]|uniref:uncharacterized protein n=1 Tax=Chironomus tepperi TaxID=113505 RepID=UPI00391F5430